MLYITVERKEELFMKKSILVLSILIPMIAHAGPGKPKHKKSHIKTHAKVKATKATEEVAPVVVSAPVEANPSTGFKTLSSLDLKDANLTLGLSADQLQISGNLPKECADHISISNIERFSSSKSADDLKGVDSDKSVDLKEYSSTIQAQITFCTDAKTPTLKDCIANAKSGSEMVDLSKDPNFSRTVSLSPELAIAGIVGEPMTLKSPEFIKMEKELQKLDCKECNSDWKLLSSHLSEAKELNSPLLASMMNKLFDGALVDMDKKISDSNTLNSLEKMRDQLLEMSAYATTEEQRELALSLFDKISEKNLALAGSGFKTASMATKHADFAKQTYSKVAKLAGLSAEKRDEYNAKAAEFNMGNEKRVQFIASIDGDHPEVRQYLKNSDNEQLALQYQIQKTCSGYMNQYKFTQCGELQNKYSSNQQAVQGLQTQFNLADNKNWNGIFSYWDKKNISYDQQWKTSFIHPTNTISTNSLPVMYDPRDPKYANFDASKLYQPNMMMPQVNSPYNEQTFTVTPTIH